MTINGRIIAVALGPALVACGGPASPSTPLAPTTPSTPPPVVQPVLQPVITLIAPVSAAIGGGAWGTITGTGFRAGATVSFGSSAAAYTLVVGDGIIRFATRSHPAGVVDVVVTNPGGLRDTAARGFTFEPPDVFDFDGAWDAHAGPEFETPMTFVVRDKRVASVSCADSALDEFSSAPLVVDGQFSIAGDGVEMSARIVSADQAVGTITLGSCAGGWWAVRVSSPAETKR
jgi:hypothetical protein